MTAALGITSRRWTLAAAAADLLGHGISGSVPRQRLRRVASSTRTEGGKAVRRGRARDRRRPHAEERDERVVRRRLQRRPSVDLQDQHLGAGCARAGQRSLGAEGSAAGGARRVREPGVEPSGVDLGGWSWGAQFGDLNNDGTLDLYLVNGYVSAGERTSYWYDFAEIAVGHSAHHRRRAQLAARCAGRSLSGYQRKRVWMNDGVGRFTDVAQDVGVDRHLRRPRRRAGGSVEPRRARRASSPTSAGRCWSTANTVAPGRHWIAFELEGTRQQPQRDRRARRSALERPAPGAGSQRRQRVQRAESAPAALRPWDATRGRPRRDPLAVRPAPDDRSARRSTSCTAEGVAMSTDTAACRRPARCPRAGAADARQPVPAADPHHGHPDHRAPDVRHPRGLRAHRRWRSSTAIVRRAGAGPPHVRTVAAPGERLHHRHQRRHPGPVAVPVAVLLREPDLDPVEVRAAARTAGTSGTRRTSA